MSKTHPSCATLNTEKTYFETCAHNRWRFSDFLKHCGPDHERLEAGCKWMQALESIIDGGNAEYRGTAQRLLNRYLDIQHAETYFKTVQPALWDINEFLFHNENAAKRSDTKEVNSLLCDAWVRGLRQASEDTERTESDRLTARRLLNKYSGTDIDKSRISRFIHAFGSKEAAIHITQPAIVINGNGNKATLTATNPTPSVNHTNKKKRGASAPRHANKKRNTASVPRFLEWFRHTWNSLEESKKWRLPVDTAISDPTAAKFRYVEDVLYHNFKDADKELAVHSWVIDTTDISVEQCFSSGAWKMICEQMPPLPKPDGWFLEAIVRYREFNSPSQLLHHLRTTPPFKLDEVDTLDDDEKHGRMWLDDVMRCWSRLLGSSGDLFTRNHKEHWYTTNIWGPVYDQCMGTIAGSYMSRGESKSLCTSDRKNSSRPHSRKRQLVGHLYDGLLTLDRHEVGAVEHSRTFTSMYDKKWTRDTLKVVKVLHDMLYKLQQSPVPLRGENRPQVQGVVTGGWCCQAWRMVIGGGYMCVLAGDTLREIPGTYDRIDNLFQHLTRFWVLRNVLKDCKKSLNPTVSRSHAEILDFLCEAESSTDIEGSITIPRSVETDCTSDSEEEEGR